MSQPTNATAAYSYGTEELISLFESVAIPSKGSTAHSVKEFEKGEFIYFPNESTKKIFLVKSGRVKIGSYSKSGREILNGILQKGEMFGEQGLLGQEERNEYAQAMDRTEIQIVSLDSFKGLMQSNYSFSMYITHLIGQKLIRAQKRIEAHVFRNARSRIIEYLRDLAIEKGERIGYELLVRQFFTHQEIANLTGTSRQTVTTTLNELRDLNYIYFNRKRLLIRDIEKLGSLI